MRERRKVLTGRVVSNKMSKTVVVVVERTRRHPLYGKVLQVAKRFKAHDETNACRVGDRVRIVESRPLSKEKRWRVAEIVERGEVLEVPEAATQEAILGEIEVVSQPAAPAAEVMAEATPAPAPEAAT